MNRKIVILVFLIGLLHSPLQAEIHKKPDETWHTFYFPEKLDLNSPLNIGKLVLDAPAGKHGFCKVKDGHFYFEDGTRAKFWGTNLCFNACFPTPREAEILADRIAYFGFNAVRLHHMDYYFEPKGIFKDIRPMFKKQQMKKTGVLSKKQLNKLDYLIYQLKIRGIYINMNLLVSRHFTEADGIKEAMELRAAAKPVSMFDPNLIEKQKQYANDLLTHYNPYTKLRYCDDPAIALLEITNENSILEFWHSNELNGKLAGLKKKAIPEYYVKQLDTLWNTWLKKKYGTTENVRLAWEQNKLPTIPQEPIISDLNPWTLEQNSGATGQLSKTPDGFILKRTSGNPHQKNWHLQLKTAPISLTKDSIYILKFSAKSENSTTLSCIAEQAHTPWKNLGLNESIELSKEWQNFEIRFISNTSCSDSKVAFLFGNSSEKIQLKDIYLNASEYIDSKKTQNTLQFSFSRPIYKLRSFYPPQQIQDCRNFYIELEQSYFREMISLLRNSIGIRIPITGIGGFWALDDIEAMKDCDFLDKHAYWDHPKFSQKGYDLNIFKIHNKSIFLDTRLGIINSFDNLSSTLNNSKPFTISEWNHCYPNKYAYETPLLLAAKAKSNDWDALFQFAFSQGWDHYLQIDKISNFFDIIANSQQLILCGFGSYLFLCDNPINTIPLQSGMQVSTPDLSATITTNNFQQNVSIKFIYDKNNPPFEIVIGEIKNTGSNWDNKKFNWGHKPTIIKRK